MLRDRGFTGSAVQLRRHVRTVRPTPPAEAYLRLATLRGEQAQADWAHFGAIQIGRARRALSCFVLVLSWSRAVYARFALDQTLESFLRGHVEAFTTLTGELEVPHPLEIPDVTRLISGFPGSPSGVHLMASLRSMDQCGPQRGFSGRRS